VKTGDPCWVGADVECVHSKLGGGYGGAVVVPGVGDGGGGKA
jgi:hypothetical protein